jgi:hypothetical protein
MFFAHKNSRKWLTTLMAYDPFIVGMVFGGNIVQSALCPKQGITFHFHRVETMLYKR